MAQQTKVCVPAIAEVPGGILVPVVSQITWLDMLRAAPVDPADQGRRFWKLFQNDITPTVETVLADLVEATFDGYASIETAGQQPADENPEGWGQANIPEVTFNMTGAVTPNTIYGGYLLNQAGALLGLFRFPNPVGMNESGDTIIIDSTLQIRAAVQGEV